MSLNGLKNFDDIKVSTQTVIIYTNLKLQIDKIFDTLPITEYEVVKKKRGRKKKGNDEVVQQVIPYGSIITLKYEDKHRGVLLKQKKQKSKSASKKTECYFRNSLTIVTYIDEKMINYKVSDNGRLQVTGCKNNEQAIKIFENFYEKLKEYAPNYFSFEGDLECIYRVVMTNIDFSLGFMVNREALDKHINMNTEYTSLLETSFGYQGVNIKVPLDLPEHTLLKRVYTKETTKDIRMPYEEFLDILNEKERKKEVAKKRYNTFLVFNSGIVIMSSMMKDFMKPYYEEFIEMVRDNLSEFKEEVE